MKYLSLILSLVLLAVSTQGADTVTTATGASTNSVATVGQTISQVTVANTSTNPAVLALFDAPSTNLTYVRGIYATFNVSNITQTVTITNTGNVLQTNTYAGLWTYGVTNAATTNAFKLITRIAVPASTTVTWTPLNGVSTTFGLLSTNDNAGTFTYSMSPNF